MPAAAVNSSSNSVYQSCRGSNVEARSWISVEDDLVGVSALDCVVRYVGHVA